MLNVGDIVEVVKPFFWYRHERYEIGERFVFEEQHVGHNFEKWVKKVALNELETYRIALPLESWREDNGSVLWWTFPIEEPPYCGSPLDSDWPDYHTHWTPLIIPVDANSEVSE